VDQADQVDQVEVEVVVVVVAVVVEVDEVDLMTGGDEIGKKTTITIVIVDGCPQHDMKIDTEVFTSHYAVHFSDDCSSSISTSPCQKQR
jgi:hypothetical protein